MLSGFSLQMITVKPKFAAKTLLPPTHCWKICSFPGVPLVFSHFPLFVLLPCEEESKPVFILHSWVSHNHCRSNNWTSALVGFFYIWLWISQLFFPLNPFFTDSWVLIIPFFARHYRTETGKKSQWFVLTSPVEHRFEIASQL